MYTSCNGLEPLVVEVVFPPNECKDRHNIDTDADIDKVLSEYGSIRIKKHIYHVLHALNVPQNTWRGDKDPRAPGRITDYNHRRGKAAITILKRVFLIT